MEGFRQDSFGLQRDQLAGSDAPWYTFWFHKMYEISRLAKRPLACQDGLSPT
jgi:hypothetical protein